MDRARIERLEALPDLLRGMATSGECDTLTHEEVAMLRDAANALPALLRLARAVAGAPRAEARMECDDSAGYYHVEPVEWPDEEAVRGLYGQTVLLVRADAADTTAGEGNA